MKQEQIFTKTLREAPKNEISVNAKLLVRAGFVDKLMSGVYTFLPLGQRVMKKIENIIREEMNAIGGQEIFMPSLQPKELWEKTGRWNSMDDLYKVKDKSEHEFALGPTHEEIIAPLVKKFVQSYKDLPLYVYQFQNKFRMELRSKSGLIRGREFIMKDLYSFHLTQADLDEYYKKVLQAYKNIFSKLEIGDRTYVTFASGGSFSKYSHEFQTITSAGEDIIYICKKCKLAINEEIKPETKNCPECGENKFQKEKSVEVGNIFKLGTKYSAPFDLFVMNKKGKKETVIMGCYGIGLARSMGTIVEVFHDNKGIIWPMSVAPFQAHLLALDQDLKIVKQVDELYEKLQKANIEVLYDNRNITVGQKFAEADLIGIPYRVVISKKSLKAGGVEIKKRNENKSYILKTSEIIKFFLKKYAHHG